MSRASVVLNVLLILVVAALAWALCARTDGSGIPEKRMSADNSGGTVPPASGIDADTVDRLAIQLARIDARLAALEAGASRGAATAPDTRLAASAMSAAEADRRLGLMLSGKDMSHQQLAMFHFRLAPLSPADQFALSSALSRAINDQRIRIRP